MKMRAFFIPIIGFMSCLSLISCSFGHKNHSREDILGVWVCGIQNDDYMGFEEMEFFSDGRFVVTDSGRFSGMDGGFIFSMDLVSSIDGSWSIVNDSLFISYNVDDLKILPCLSSFKVKAENEGADTLLLESFKEDMARDLSCNIIEMYTGQYRSLSGREVLLGKIVSLSDDQFKIENSGAQIEFHRNISKR